MHPKLFGFIDSYYLFIFIGIVLCLFVFEFYLRKQKVNRNTIFALEVFSLIVIVFGFFSSAVFQGLYDYIENPEMGFSLESGTTFLGGLIGGVIFFLLGYHFYFKKKYGLLMNKIIVIAPASIAVSQAFGRIGCFLNGCCYGVKTDSIFGVKFDFLPYKVVPTQLLESSFLIILFVLLFLLAVKGISKYTMPIYMVCYGIFRFIIEYFRDDDRGALIKGLSPSQFWCILMIILAIPVFLFIKKRYNAEFSFLEETDA